MIIFYLSSDSYDLIHETLSGDGVFPLLLSSWIFDSVAHQKRPSPPQHEKQEQANIFPADKIHQGQWCGTVVLVQQDKNMSVIKETYQ